MNIHLIDHSRLWHNRRGYRNGAMLKGLSYGVKWGNSPWPFPRFKKKLFILDIFFFNSLNVDISFKCQNSLIKHRNKSILQMFSMFQKL